MKVNLSSIIKIIILSIVAVFLFMVDMGQQIEIDQLVKRQNTIMKVVIGLRNQVEILTPKEICRYGNYEM